MNTNRIVLNETSYFGPGSRSVIPEEVKRRNLKKAFIVTDNDLVKFGVVKQVTDILEQAAIPYTTFAEVKQNPTVTNVKAGVKAYAASAADFIIAIGGGSPTDTAKAIGIITNNPEFSNVVSLEGVANTKNKSVPIIALPTTAGTAAEVTINYVITDEENVKKMVCVDPNDIPVLAIVDAELMSSMPKSLTAATGMDALTHAIEGYITNLEARNGMAVAQYIAGMGFSNVGLGAVHGMAHPLGAFYNIPHGVANALLLPYVMEYNMPSSIQKYKKIPQAMGCDIQGMNDETAAIAAVESVKQLSLKIGIPQKLSEIGVKEEDLEQLAQSAYADVCTPGNPRDVTVEDLLALYRKAYI